MCDDNTKMLGIGAVIDAIHDFNHQHIGKELGILDREKIKNGVTTGINLGACDELDDISTYEKYYINGENKFLQDCVSEDISTHFETIEKLLKFIEDNNYTKEFITINKKKYTVKLLEKNGDIVRFESNPDRSVLKANDIIKFMGNNLNIVADASVIRFLKGIETISDKDKLNINMVINRERINDSASPPTNSLVYIKNIFDVSRASIEYKPLTEFNSIYKVFVGPLEPQDAIETGCLGVRFRIKNDDKILCDSDGSFNFTRAYCVEKITNTRNPHIKSAYYQAKRAGDWLQALSCLNKDNRDYRVEGERESIKIKKMKLLLSDRILLAYCLLIGADALFLTKTNAILYFEAKPTIKVAAKRGRNNNQAPEPASKKSKEDEIAKILEKLDDLRKEYITSRIKYMNTVNNENTKIALEKWGFIYKKILDYISDNASTDEVGDEVIDIIDKQVDKIVEDHVDKKVENVKNPPFRFFGGEPKTTEPRITNYFKELTERIEGFDSDENHDYEFYEKVACIALACKTQFNNEELESIFFETLPSIEGYITTENENFVKFFEGDNYMADCVSFAARQVALGSIGLRTGSLKSLSDIKVDIFPNAVDAYKNIYSALPPDFNERQSYILKQIAKIDIIHSSKSVAKATLGRATLGKPRNVTQRRRRPGLSNTRRVLRP